VVVAAAELPDGAIVQADRDRVMQVLGNLVGNALKFTAPGGRVTLSARCEGDAVVFAVADTGTGIAAEDLPHVFEQYWKHDQQGTGLGLFIARSVVQAHRGRMWVTSKPGAGSTFFFTLLLATQVRVGSEDAAAATTPTPEPVGAR
jgi:signal transduction histidine kinase